MKTTCAAAALSPEKKRGRAGLTVPYRTLGSAFRNDGARAERGGERIGKWRTRWGRTVEEELGLQWRRRRSARAERGRESERGRAGGRKWLRGRRRARQGAPSGRPGRVQATACSPHGSRALPARHDGAARPSARVHGAGASAGTGKGRARAGWAGFGQRAKSEAAAC